MTQRTVSRTRLTLILALCFVLVLAITAFITLEASSNKAFAEDLNKTSAVTLTGSVEVTAGNGVTNDGGYVISNDAIGRGAIITVTYKLNASNLWALEIVAPTANSVFKLESGTASAINGNNAVVTGGKVTDGATIMWSTVKQSASDTTVLTLTYSVQSITPGSYNFDLGSAKCVIGTSATDIAEYDVTLAGNTSVTLKNKGTISVEAASFEFSLKEIKSRDTAQAVANDDVKYGTNSENRVGVLETYYNYLVYDYNGYNKEGGASEVTIKWYENASGGEALSAAPTGAGTYYVSASVAESDNYTAAESERAQVVINPFDLKYDSSNLTANPTSKTYNGSAISWETSEITLSGDFSALHASVTAVSGSRTEVGNLDLSVTITPDTNYAVSTSPVTLQVTITAYELTINPTAQSETYDGSDWSTKLPQKYTINSFSQDNLTSLPQFVQNDLASLNIKVVANTPASGWKNVGSEYTLGITYDSNNNYNITTGTATFTITTYALTINPTAQTETYDSTDWSTKLPQKYTINSFSQDKLTSLPQFVQDDLESLAIKVIAQSPTSGWISIGSNYTLGIQYTNNNNYTITTGTATFTITAATNFWTTDTEMAGQGGSIKSNIWLADKIIYLGGSQPGATYVNATAEHGNVSITWYTNENCDVTASTYNAGKYWVKATATADGYDTLTTDAVEVNIVKATITVKVTLDAKTGLTYNGQAHKYVEDEALSYTLSANNQQTISTSDVSYKITYGDNDSEVAPINAGTHKVTVTFILDGTLSDNYDIVINDGSATDTSAKAETSLTIEKAVVTVTVDLAEQKDVYNGDTKAYNPSYEVATNNSLTVDKDDDIDVKIEYTQEGVTATPIDAGTYNVKLTFSLQNGLDTNYNLVVKVKNEDANRGEVYVETTFEIERATNTVEWQKGETGVDLRYLVDPTTGADGNFYATATNGSVTYQYSKSENEGFTSLEELAGGCKDTKHLDVATYYVKAIVAASKNYAAGESTVATFTVSQAQIGKVSLSYNGGTMSWTAIAETTDGKTIPTDTYIVKYSVNGALQTEISYTANSSETFTVFAVVVAKDNDSVRHNNFADGASETSVKAHIVTFQLPTFDDDEVNYPVNWESGSQTQYVFDGQKATAPDTTSETSVIKTLKGTKYTYNFNSWTSSNDTAVTGDITSDTTFTAKYDQTAESFQVKYKYANGDQDTYANEVTESVDFDGSLKAMSVVTWFEFDGWYSDDARTKRVNNLSDLDDLTDITLYGKYVFKFGVGDVNGDGKVDINDVTDYCKYLVGGYDLEAINSKADAWKTAKNEAGYQYDESATYFFLFNATIKEGITSDLLNLTLMRMAIVGGYDLALEGTEGVNQGIVEKQQATETVPEGNDDANEQDDANNASVGIVLNDNEGESVAIIEDVTKRAEIAILPSFKR